METVSPIESKVSMIGTGVITISSLYILDKTGILKWVDFAIYSNVSKFIAVTTLLILAIFVYVILYALTKVVFSVIHVKNKIYTIVDISDHIESEKYGAWGGWDKQLVKLKDKKNNKVKEIYLYPNIAKKYKVGDQVYLCKRERSHTYEMTSYLLFRKEQFTLNSIRKKYIFGEVNNINIKSI